MKKESTEYKRLLVTGGNGFLGSKVLDMLRSLNYKDVFAPKSSAYDLREQAQVRRLMRDFCPDLVIHLAGVIGGIKKNRENPGDLFYENLIMGTMAMEEARRAKAKKFVTVGTVCSYPKFAAVPFCEDDLWLGYPEETNASYGMAKKMLLVQAQAYRQQYNFNAICLLPVNLYGPGDSFDLSSSHVMPALIRKCLEAVQNREGKVIAWGNGNATREFLHVEDCARGIVLATEKYNSAEPVNIGSGREISIKELAKMISELTGFAGEIIWDDNMPNGQLRRQLDTSRAKQLFDFESKIKLEDGLKQTIAWYRSRMHF